jgi:hypothetical protein
MVLPSLEGTIEWTVTPTTPGIATICCNSPALPNYRFVHRFPMAVSRQDSVCHAASNACFLFPFLGWQTGSWQWNPQGTDGAAGAGRVGALGIRWCSFPDRSRCRHASGAQQSASSQKLPPFLLPVHRGRGRRQWKWECQCAHVVCVCALEVRRWPSWVALASTLFVYHDCHVMLVFVTDC